MAKSVYIHIPFCDNICSYCDFCKLYTNEKFIDKYLNSLENEIENKYKKETDDITKFVQEKLKQQSSMKPIKQCNLSNLYANKKLIESFNGLANYMKTDGVICGSDVFGYKLELRKSKYNSVTELKKGMGVSGSLSNEFTLYKSNDLFGFVKKANDNHFTTDQILNGLMQINVTVLNSGGNELSGGERAEFNLLKELKDSDTFDVLLLDEPEASFDNPFIKESVAGIIKNFTSLLVLVFFIASSSNGIISSYDIDTQLFVSLAS